MEVIGFEVSFREKWLNDVATDGLTKLRRGKRLTLNSD